MVKCILAIWDFLSRMVREDGLECYQTAFGESARLNCDSAVRAYSIPTQPVFTL